MCIIDLPHQLLWARIQIHVEFVECIGILIHVRRWKTSCYLSPPGGCVWATVWDTVCHYNYILLSIHIVFFTCFSEGMLGVKLVLGLGWAEFFRRISPGSLACFNMQFPCVSFRLGPCKCISQKINNKLDVLFVVYLDWTHTSIPDYSQHSLVILHHSHRWCSR